jgi:hypothetical protein
MNGTTMGVRQLLLCLLTTLSVGGYCQQLPLSVDGGYLKKGRSNKITYQRPDSLSSVHMRVPTGTVSSSFISSTSYKDGKQSSSADSVFNWKVCDYLEPRTWALAEGYVDGRLVLSDTSWFTVISDSIQTTVIGPEENTNYHGRLFADEWTGVGAPTISFFSKEPAAEIIDYEVLITQQGRQVERFTVTGAMLSAEQRKKMRKYTSGEVLVHKIRCRHSCGVELPSRYTFRMRYAAPR